MEIKISSKSKKVDFEHRQKTWHGFQSKTSLSKFCVPIDTKIGGVPLINQKDKHIPTLQQTRTRHFVPEAPWRIYKYPYLHVLPDDSM